MGVVFRNALLQLRTLSVSEWNRATIGSDAVPNFLYQCQALLDRQTIDSQGFD
jgi:hypothetical protein